ncbi:RecB family exonuclease [Desulfovibrio inopinatus]|uniref:RecB family exonuclease n=1 Tax=Desulfovibrio inopinatus TaxID=102109 RepID=UPI000420BC4E|nr:PD-(D/E)XK nuclease family protein [Desulfovibrio inopinatus]
MNPIRLRASSLKELMDCPARWEAKNIKGLRTPSGPNAVLGKAVHASTAVFDQSRMDGAGLTPDDAAGALVDEVYKPKEDVVWDDSSPKEVENIGLALHSLYCTTVSPNFEYAGVEILCTGLEITDLGLLLTGTTDRVVFSGVGHGIADVKTGKNVVGKDRTIKTQGYGLQIAIYELLAQAAMGVPITEPGTIIGLQAAKTDRGRRAGVTAVHGTRDILLGDEDHPGVLHHASRILHGGYFHGNPSSMMCGPKYCPIHQSCRYRA